MLDLFRSVVLPHGEPKASAREILGDAEGCEDVRWLERAARAGAAAGCGDAGEVERDENRLALDVLEAGGEIVGSATKPFDRVRANGSGRRVSV